MATKSGSVGNLLKRSSRHGRQRSWSDTNIERLICTNQIVEISFTLGIIASEKEQQNLRKQWASKPLEELTNEVDRLRTKLSSNCTNLKQILENCNYAITNMDIDQLCLTYYTLKMDCIDTILIIMKQRNTADMEKELPRLKAMDTRELVHVFITEKTMLTDEIVLFERNMFNAPQIHDDSVDGLCRQYNTVRDRMIDKIIIYNNMLRRDYDATDKSSVGDYRTTLLQYNATTLINKYNNMRNKILQRIYNIGITTELACSDETLQTLYKEYWKRKLAM